VCFWAVEIRHVGTKSVFLEIWAITRMAAFLCFDYSWARVSSGCVYVGCFDLGPRTRGAGLVEALTDGACILAWFFHGGGQSMLWLRRAALVADSVCLDVSRP